MAKWVDIDPKSPTDSLKKLLADTRNKQTVPHGVKVAGSDERVVFYDSSDTARVWDGDTIAAYDKRIEDAQEQIKITGDSLHNTEQNLAGAAERIKAVEGATTPTAIGDTAAAQINDRQLIVGRDAVVPGTLDVAQMNVTGQMSAAIVSAMSLESKKLVVTGEAIMNQLTVIQDIVTPQLIAQKIDVKNLGAQLVTAGALQTDSAANRGVKISNAGMTAYNDSGTLTMRLDGKDNYLVGNLSTSGDAQTGINLVHKGSVAGVELFSPTRASDNSLLYSHGAMWYTTPDFPPDQRGLSIFATDKSAVQSGDPGIMLRPAMGIGMQGRISSFGSAIKTGSYTHSGLDANNYFTFRGSFAGNLTAGTQACVLISVVTANKNEMSWGIANDGATGFDALIKNLTPRATGTVWVKWIAFAI